MTTPGKANQVDTAGELPVRRKDLVALGDTFKKALEPVGAVVKHMQEQNQRSAVLANKMEAHSRRMTSVYRWLVTTFIGVGLGVALMSFVLIKILEVVTRVEGTATQLKSVAAAAESAYAAAAEAREEAEAAAEAQEARGRVEIVAETDPSKAKDSPMKVRIVAPRPTESVEEEPDTSDLSTRERPPASASPPVQHKKAPTRKSASPPSRAVEIPISKEALRNIE